MTKQLTWDYILSIVVAAPNISAPNNYFMARRKNKSGFESLKLNKDIFLSAPKSYISLLYGVVSVVILFVILFFLVNMLTQRNPGSVGEDGIQTSELKKTYLVKAGDTLWSIAETQYKDGYMWTQIATANKLSNPDEIEVGMKLTIPSLPASASPTTSPTFEPTSSAKDSKISGSAYTVVAGDNLWTIAVRAYGDGYKWTEIAKVNKLSNPDLIHPGNVFTLPR